MFDEWTTLFVYTDHIFINSTCLPKSTDGEYNHTASSIGSILYRYGNVNKNKSPALDIKIIEDSHAVHQKNRRRV